MIWWSGAHTTILYFFWHAFGERGVVYGPGRFEELKVVHPGFKELEIR